MSGRREFGQGILFTFTNYIYWFILTNIYFVFCNIIFLVAFITLEPVFSNTVLIFIALIPTGPAITALWHVMDKLVRAKEISPTKDFFYGYKLNFKDTLKVWLPMLGAIFILVIDLQYFQLENTGTNQVLAIVFLIMLFFLIYFLFYVLPITAKFNFRVRDVYKLSFYYSFKKIKKSTGNMGMIFITIFLTYITTSFLILFIASILCYLLTSNSREVIDDIELNYTNK